MEIMTKVTVSGTGKSQGTPDIAIIQIEVKNEDKDQLECRRANNVGSESVVAALKQVVEENDIYATPARVTPQYKHGFIGTRVAKYQGHNKITATVRRLEEAQELARQLNNLDEKMIQVCSFQFDIEDKEQLETTARCAAFANAKRRAETYAKEIEFPVSGVETIEEHLRYSDSARHPSGKFGMIQADSDFWIPARGEEETLEIGDIELTVNVTVCFRIGDEN
jgi:uncharacterized protein YggE